MTSDDLSRQAPHIKRWEILRLAGLRLMTPRRVLVPRAAQQWGRLLPGPSSPADKDAGDGFFHGWTVNGGVGEVGGEVESVRAVPGGREKMCGRRREVKRCDAVGWWISDRSDVQERGHDACDNAVMKWSQEGVFVKCALNYSRGFLCCRFSKFSLKSIPDSHASPQNPTLRTLPLGALLTILNSLSPSPQHEPI